MTDSTNGEVPFIWCQGEDCHRKEDCFLYSDRNWSKLHNPKRKIVKGKLDCPGFSSNYINVDDILKATRKLNAVRIPTKNRFISIWKAEVPERIDYRRKTMIEIKHGVIIEKLTTEMMKVIDKTITVWQVLCPTIVPVITSAFDTDPDRVEKTKHAIHQALDFRTRDIKYFGTQVKVAEALTNILGSDFDVVLEKDHIHVEYDPK